MPKKRSSNTSQKPIEQYEHKGKDRLNNPPVGLVDSKTDNGGGPKKKKYEYDPHLDPQLVWAGKAEHTSFDVPTVSLHVHERIDPRRIIETVRKEAETRPVGSVPLHQPSLFETEKKPLREAIEFYKHKENWSNRLIAGDSLLVMNSLIEKEGMAGKVQMVYFDPPYGIKYGSNFQPFVNKRDVKDGKDEDLTAEPEMIKAFRDTWELGIHSYLTYLRDRLLLAQEVLHESGSIFVQISDENVHRVRNLMDEVFGAENFVTLISFTKTSGLESASRVASRVDYLVWYAKDSSKNIFHRLYTEKTQRSVTGFTNVEFLNGERRRMTNVEQADPGMFEKGVRFYKASDLTKPGPGSRYDIEFQGKVFSSGKRWWGTTPESMQKLIGKNRVIAVGNTLAFVRYLEDFPYAAHTNLWLDTGIAGFMGDKRYVVETNPKVIERCLLMTTDPGDLVLDITCGSGTTAFVAENWGRRWITCDTSRVATALAKQRLMTGDFDYFELAHPDEGVGSGFKYKTVPHITLKSIANNEPAPQETLYDQPFIDNKKLRITGPFTVEAVPAPFVKSPESEPGAIATGFPADEETTPSAEAASTPPLKGGELRADASVARSGETLRQSEWIARLWDGGVRGKGGSKIEFSHVEPLGGTHFLQAEAETKPSTTPSPDHPADEASSPLLKPGGELDPATPPNQGGELKPKRVVICFGPEHAPLEQRLVEAAIDEARSLVPKPEIVLFCAFQFDPEARKDIDEMNWPGITLLEAQMDSDLQMDDLKKKPRDKDSTAFWLIGQPEVKISRASTTPSAEAAATPPNQGGELYQVEVLGFDYYNPKTGSVESGGKGDIAMWMLDPDYDGRSLFPTQVFFPMAGDKDGWAKLAKNLKAEIDEEKIEAFRGTVSLPFEPGRKVAVKIIDARGIESLKIIHL